VGYKIIPTTYTINNNSVIMNPESDLEFNTEYIIVCTTNIKNIYGSDLNSRIENQFRTEEEILEQKSIKINSGFLRTVNITQPNGGETVSVSSTYNILWSSEELLSTENVKIDLYKNDMFNSEIIASTLNNGSYTWNPTGTTLDTDYKIKITLISDTNVNDMSNNNFEVGT